MLPADKSLVIVGLSWGDEGKGKFVDYLAGQFDGTVRYNGGNNAGHTVKVRETTVHFSLMPAAALRGGLVYIAQAVVINPVILLKEIELVKKMGIKLDLRIDPRCHVVMPYHQLMDVASEAYKGKQQTGSLKLGIGFCYEDRTNRAGIRMVDLLDGRVLRRRLQQVWEVKRRRIERVYGSKFDLDLETVWGTFRRWGRRLKSYIFPVAEYLQDNFTSKKFLFEAAQGAYLDYSFGTYPYTVAYQTTAAAALTDTGLPPSSVNVLGVVKAYATRVGNGPFPTELNNRTGQYLQQKGQEFGTVSRRPRRCGWLDLVMVKQAIKLNGVSYLALTKLDILGGLPKIKLGVGYRIKGKKIERVPVGEKELGQVKPDYQVMPGWENEIQTVVSFRKLPLACRQYIQTVEDYLRVPIKFVSVGPERNQTLVKS